MNIYRFFITALLSLFLLTPAMSQEAADAKSTEPTDVEEVEFEVADAGAHQYFSDYVLRREAAEQARIERGMAVPMPRTVRKGYWYYVIEHRTATALDDDPFHNFLGFDTGEVKIGFGLRYGLTDEFDAGVYRQNGTVEQFDTYQFDGRYHLLSESDYIADLAFQGGASLFAISGEDDAWGGFGAVHMGRTVQNRVYLQTGFLYHSNSSARDKTAADEKDSSSILGTVSLRLKDKLLWMTDYSVPVIGYEAESIAWSTGVKYVTHGHSFALAFGNTQYTTLDGLAAGSSFDDGDVLMGFSITREFR